MESLSIKEERQKVTAPELLLKVVLSGTQTHYEYPGMIDETRLEHMLHCGKQILYKSHQESDVRQNLGFSHAVWQGLTEVLVHAIPELERKSFSYKNPPESSFNGSSSEVIVFNYFSIVKDIERLNDLCTIGRNLLATTKKAQNLAAEKGFDQQILKLIDICVRVTSRGFDGENNARNEERWQKVVTLYKRLLITCLQFLHNFIMHNEHRKLVLWLDLFGNSQQHTDIATPQLQQSYEPTIAQAEQEARIKATADKLDPTTTFTPDGSLGYNIDDVHALFDLMSTDKPPDGSTQEAAKMLMDKIRKDMERLSGLSANELDEDPSALLKVGAALRAQLPEKDFPVRPSVETARQIKKAVVSIDRNSQSGQAKAANWTDLPNVGQLGDMPLKSTEVTTEDMSMPRSAESAAETLQEAKGELMARLQDANILPESNLEHHHVTEDDHAQIDSIEEADVVSEDVEEEEEEDEDDDDEEDDDYQSPGDQERGLLTDVPLVLGPSEIEALPMIIQAGIVDSFGLKGGERSGSKNMQAVRCHILLAQEAGRNLLRELLIFIAAWDLPDEEFYFKMMVQIMEAILKNGLMSHAYSDFGQAKDIISPAQAVVIKILTHIFRAKYSPTTISNANNQQSLPHRVPAPLTKVDVLTVRYIFTVFRGNIIPETCALIYLQGQIRAGHAQAEVFPLNLWDMERVYEGVYQFLEFFAVLTESNDWKALLVEWEIVYDLVTLIKELDASIPKATLTKQVPAPGVKHGETQPAASAQSANGQSEKSASSAPSPVTVERPYDQDPDGTDLNPAGDVSPPLGTEDPAEFEWRNLKKLIVLVLSSLVWKSPVVQDQIRKHGGVEVILGCTQFDAHNPYIKEHAVMCLKFLLEGNKSNQEIVEQLEAREVVRTADGVLEKMGVEATVEGGKVKLAAIPKPM